MGASSDSLLDRWPARVVALLIAVGIGVLLYRISPSLSWELERLPQGLAVPQAAVPNDPAFEACFAKEKAVVGKMQDDGLVDADKAAVFLSRAEARCRATTAQ